ncbi:Uncharacterised protein [Legionella busanensis]|uniref:Uncharacterized protein n=1 Tax=Legionella busanensis TaxID=190655 RepID=A0A378JFN7_9GAMM|nr:hypothetical protein [Legionella busanensis]STX49995.1 Uncharacterised protein [Legionella busanensis]
MAPRFEKRASDSNNKYLVFLADCNNLNEITTHYLNLSDVQEARADLNNLNEIISIIETWQAQGFDSNYISKVIDQVKDRMGFEAIEREVKSKESYMQSSKAILGQNSPYELSLEELILLYKLLGRSKDSRGIDEALSREDFITQLRNLAEDKVKDNGNQEIIASIETIIKKINNPTIGELDLARGRNNPDKLWDYLKFTLNRKLNQAYQFIEERDMYHETLLRQKAMERGIQFLTGDNSRTALQLLKEKKEKIQAYLAPIDAINRDMSKYGIQSTVNATNLKKDLKKI